MFLNYHFIVCDIYILFILCMISPFPSPFSHHGSGEYKEEMNEGKKEKEILLL